MMKTKKPIIYYQNIRGLRTKATEFLNNVIETNFDFLCLTETWLNNTHSNSDYFPNNYNVFRTDRRTLSLGGGSLIAIKNNFKTLRRVDLEYGHEAVWVEVRLNNKENILLGCIYLPPNTSVSDQIIFYPSSNT